MDINTTICPQEEGEGPGIEIERKLQKKTSGNLDMELPAEAVADIDVMLPSTAQLKRNLEEEEEEEEMKGSYGCGCYQWVRIPGPGCDPAGIENLDLEKIRAEWRQEMMWLEEFELSDERREMCVCVLCSVLFQPVTTTTRVPRSLVLTICLSGWLPCAFLDD